MSNLKTKKCKECNEVKSVLGFYKNKESVDGYRHQCKDCVSKRVKRWGVKKFWKNRAKSINNGSGRRNGIAGVVINNSTPIHQEEIKSLFLKTKQCHYCGVELIREKIVFDHKTPLSRNGVHTIDNLCVSCKDCNQLKSTRTKEEFKTFLKEYIQRFK